MFRSGTDLANVVIFVAIIAHPLDVDGENRVTARGIGVHQCRADRPILPALLHQLFAAPDVVDRMHR